MLHSFLSLVTLSAPAVSWKRINDQEMNISRLYDLVLLNKYITIYKNRFNDNIYVKFTLLWNALYLIFGEK